MCVLGVPIWPSCVCVGGTDMVKLCVYWGTDRVKGDGRQTLLLSEKPAEVVKALDAMWLMVAWVVSNHVNDEVDGEPSSAESTKTFSIQRRVWRLESSRRSSCDNL